MLGSRWTRFTGFPTPPRPHDGHLRWDLARIWSQITTGLAAAGAAARSTWSAWPPGARTARLLKALWRAAGRSGQLPRPAPPACSPKWTGLVGRRRLYRWHRIAPELNTIFQLMAEARAGTLGRAERRC